MEFYYIYLTWLKLNKMKCLQTLRTMCIYVEVCQQAT